MATRSNFGLLGRPARDTSANVLQATNHLVGNETSAVNLKADTIQAISGTIETLSSGSITADDIDVPSGVIDSLTVGDLTATSVTTSTLTSGSATISGTATISDVAADSVETDTATVSGTVTAATATVSGTVTAATATVSGTVTAATATVSGTITGANTVTDTFQLTTGPTSGDLLTSDAKGIGTWQALSLGFSRLTEKNADGSNAIFATGPPGTWAAEAVTINSQYVRLRYVSNNVGNPNGAVLIAALRPAAAVTFYTLVTGSGNSWDESTLATNGTITCGLGAVTTALVFDIIYSIV